MKFGKKIRDKLRKCFWKFNEQSGLADIVVITARKISLNEKDLPLRPDNATYSATVE